MADIIVIFECFVKPKYEVEAAKKPYHLSPLEIAMLSIDPIQKGLLYNLNTTSTEERTKTISNLVEKLKHSLAFALVHFYPLAGRFATQKYPDKHACSIFVDCTKGPGAKVIHASALGVSKSDIISSIDVPKIVRSFFELGEKTVNYDGHTRPLLSIQVTELVDGVFIGFSMNHCVVDGTSFIHFVSMLSKIFKSNEHILASGSNIDTIKISRMPVFNYKPWIDNNSLDNEYGVPIKLPYLEPDEFIDHDYEPGPLRERVFHFSSTSLATLKAKVNQESDTNEYVISSFVALTALVWRSITRARNLGSNELTCCSILINARSRFDPPISNEYFGNFIGGAQLSCKVDELLGNNLGWIASNLRKVIMAQDGKTIIDLYKFVIESPFVVRRGEETDFHGQNRVIMGGSPRFDMYGPEFGLGRAVAARIGFPNKEDGKITANPGSEGLGSVELEICLRPQFMGALEADMEFMSRVVNAY